MIKNKNAKQKKTLKNFIYLISYLKTNLAVHLEKKK